MILTGYGETLKTLLIDFESAVPVGESTEGKAKMRIEALQDREEDNRASIDRDLYRYAAICVSVGQSLVVRDSEVEFGDIEDEMKRVRKVYNSVGK